MERAVECHRSDPHSSFHGAIVIPNTSPLENLCVYALLFLLGALWAHLRSNSRDAARKERSA